MQTNKTIGYVKNELGEIIGSVLETKTKSKPPIDELSEGNFSQLLDLKLHLYDSEVPVRFSVSIDLPNPDFDNKE